MLCRVVEHNPLAQAEVRTAGGRSGSLGEAHDFLRTFAAIHTDWPRSAGYRAALVTSIAHPQPTPDNQSAL